MEMLYDDLLVGEVIDEDAEFITLKVGKTHDVAFNVSEGAQFFTLAMVHQVEEGGNSAVAVWNPWDGSAV